MFHVWFFPTGLHKLDWYHSFWSTPYRTYLTYFIEQSRPVCARTANWQIIYIIKGIRLYSVPLLIVCIIMLLDCFLLLIPFFARFMTYVWYSFCVVSSFLILSGLGAPFGLFDMPSVAFLGTDPQSGTCAMFSTSEQCHFFIRLGLANNSHLEIATSAGIEGSVTCEFQAHAKINFIFITIPLLCSMCTLIPALRLL